MFFSNSEIAQMKQAVGASGATDDDDFQVVPIEKISQLRIVFNILRIVQQFTVDLNDCLFSQTNVRESLTRRVWRSALRSLRPKSESEIWSTAPSTGQTAFMTLLCYLCVCEVVKLFSCRFRRFANSEDMTEIPAWFVDDEKKHRKRPVPVTREMVEEYKQKWREINARPIKRVAEAKARKKRQVRRSCWHSQIYRSLSLYIHFIWSMIWIYIK